MALPRHVSRALKAIEAQGKLCLAPMSRKRTTPEPFGSTAKYEAAPRTRRDMLEIGCAAGLTMAGLGFLLADATAPVLAQGATVALDQLMAGDALPDIVLGASDAPVTIIEYASMTCSHCAAFHATTFQELKRKYIDTGKVRFILREFPLDPLATAGFVLARCAGDEKRTAFVDLLFTQQKNWAFVDKPLEALASLVKQTGMNQAGFDACLTNQDLYDKVIKVHDRAAALFGVKATPAFFINGKRESGELSLETLDKLLDPLLKG